MNIQKVFENFFQALSEATKLAVTNNKAITALREQVATLTTELSQAKADDEADAAKIAEYEAEKAQIEQQFAEMASKLDELKLQIEQAPMPTVPDPIVEPAPVEPTPTEPVAEAPTAPPTDVVVDPIATPGEPASIPDSGEPVPVVTPEVPSIGIQPIVGPGTINPNPIF